MSPLNFFVNLIILILGCQGILAGPMADPGTTNLTRLAAVRAGYQHTPGIGWHRFHTKSMEWYLARKVCRAEGGHLAVVNSAAEARVLTDLFNRAGPIEGAQLGEIAFLGMHELYGEDDWVTVFDQSLKETGYSRWSDKWGGQPDNGSGGLDCVAFVQEGGLDDTPCYMKLPFICEIPEM